MSKDKMSSDASANMQKTCAICGKTVDKLVTNKAHPEKGICLDCLNGFIVNLNTVEEELNPIMKSLDKAVSDLKTRLDEQ